MLKRLQRWRHARGFGIHSPFAFHLITDVVYSKHGYYAFSDIEKILHEKQIYISDPQLHHLTYRLIRHFDPASLLAIGGGGVNSLYIASAMDGKIAHCFEKNPEKRNHTENLLHGHFENIKFINKVSFENKFEAIIIDPRSSDITPDELLANSADDCFWIISGINSEKNKQFWRKIVILNKADVTFEMKNIGIVILNSRLNKRHYLI